MATSIRDARAEDYDFVVEQMVMALDPFYGGDHRAHADRIFQTHISGGIDRVGHFSEGQRIFILEDDGVRVAMINLVSKKQGTFKISPLIVAHEHQGHKGYGSILLKHVEDFAHERGARQVYCTVAAQNASALQFFQKKGYIAAGRSESHYKAGVTEVMLYRLFLEAGQLEHFDRQDISVLPMEEGQQEQVRRLILARLPQNFKGVDDAWVDAMFQGYERRLSGDVNVKYKLVYTAVDRAGTVVGVVGATPKKGEPIKLMPCIASDVPAFTALLVDVPNLLAQYGHKLYVHIVPTVEETIALQHLSWTLDALMPGAYHDERVTQQWGFELRVGFMRRMRVKQRFIDQVRGGSKKLEVRVGYSNIKKIQSGERIRMMSRSDELIIRVTDVRTYETFREMLDRENASHVVPNASRREVQQLLQRLYPRGKERLGVYVLEIEPEH